MVRLLVMTQRVGLGEAEASDDRFPRRTQGKELKRWRDEEADRVLLDELKQGGVDGATIACGQMGRRRRLKRELE
eukprot:4677212-Pleurochrysis_carterae.AAC.1